MLSCRFAAMSRIAPCNPASILKNRFSRMNGYGSQCAALSELIPAQIIMNVRNPITKRQLPMKLRNQSAARCPVVRESVCARCQFWGVLRALDIFIQHSIDCAFEGDQNRYGQAH